MKRNKKKITYLYGKKNLISTLGICDPISKKPTCILSPINQGVYYPYIFLYIFHIRPPLFSHWKPTHLDNCNVILTAKTKDL